MLQCIIFDVDGTLIDTEFAVKKSLLQATAGKLPREYTWNELDFILGIPGQVVLQQMGIEDTQEVNRQWNLHMAEYKNHTSVYPEIEETLKKLKNLNITTGIVTSKTQTEFADDFVPFGLMKYFDFYVCASDTERHKPYPDPLLKFLEISGMNAQKAIYIGDTAYDQQAADAAGIKFGLALWGTKNPDDIEAFKKIKSPSDIPDLIR